MKSKHKKTNEIEYLLYIMSLSLLLMSFLFGNINDIFNGFIEILASPSNLLTDYMKVGGVSAAFFNAFTIMMFSIFTSKYVKKELYGAEVAAIILVTGFSFFGKNIFNSFPLSIGVFIYAKLKNKNLGDYILQSLYVTALAPIVSIITFNLNLPILIDIILAYTVGIIIGLIITPLSISFLKFHKGYNLYNIGFTGGVIAMLTVGIMRMFNIKVDSVSILYKGSDLSIKIYIFSLFIFMIIYSFLRDKYIISKYKLLLNNVGKLPSDYINLHGFYTTLLNMGLMGIIASLFVIIVGGIFNGPVVGGILSVSAFSAYGKHPKNSIPIFIGVLIAGTLNIHEPSSTASILAGLFGTTLSPITGEYGIIGGIFAGFSHMAVVFNVGYLYGGANLYNNGFSGGFVAAILVPIYDEIREFKKNLIETW